MLARLARPDDADELVRLRGVMMASVHGHAPIPGDWQRHAADTFRIRTAEGTLAAFVVDRPDTSGLAACAVGTIERRLGGPDNPTGDNGYVFNVATDPDQRRRGYSRACMVALLDWFQARGVTRISLTASTEGEPLYRSLGFADISVPTLRVHL